MQITDFAEPAIKASWPKPALNIAAGVIFGLAIGIGMAFFIEYLDTSVKTIDDVERALDAPVLAVIPQNVGVLMDEGMDSPHAEPYRVLRTNILFTTKDPDIRTITVVSGGAGEGKSTTVINLATIFAQNGNRVLLVDSDLRRPSLHKRLEVENSPGLTDVLLGQKKLEDVTQTTAERRLEFLPRQAAEQCDGDLNSQQMRDFIKEAREKYDYVLFDSSPLMGSATRPCWPAKWMSPCWSSSIASIRSRWRCAHGRWWTGRGRLLGVVLNNINVSNDASYYYYSGGHYHSENTAEDFLDLIGKMQRHPKATKAVPRPMWT